MRSAVSSTTPTSIPIWSIEKRLDTLDIVRRSGGAPGHPGGGLSPGGVFPAGCLPGGGTLPVLLPSPAYPGGADREKGSIRRLYDHPSLQPLSEARSHPEIAESVAGQQGIPFLYRDFREGWSEGVRISKEIGMYRQPYCGCIYSEKERYCRPSRRGTGRREASAGETTPRTNRLTELTGEGRCVASNTVHESTADLCHTARKRVLQTSLCFR